MSFLIGEAVTVAAARNGTPLGLEGEVVLESMHTLTIRTKMGRKLTLPKLGSALQLSTGKLVIGDDLEGRLEDRIAAGGRANGRTRRMR